MKTLLQLACLHLLLSLVSHSVFGQQTFRTTPTSVIGYLEYLPADYHKNSDKYPVVIFLHGIGERGPNSNNPAVLEASKDLLAKHGPPKYAASGTQFPFILISPHLKNNYSTWPTSYVMEVINHVKTYLRIDERRIHITGMSLGGGGTWTMAQDFPKLFASVAPICGGYNAPSKACAIAAENIPVWAFHGDADPTVPISRSVDMVKAINSCTPSPNPPAKMTVYAGVKHNAWDRAFVPDHSWHKPNVYEWMMSFTNTINGKNKIPIANAGTDKTTALKTLTINGSATDSDGSIVSWAWTKLSGPSCTLTNANTSTLSVSGLTPGVYMFRMTVKDNSGDTDSDYVRVTVHHAPVADAGPDVSIKLPTNSVILTGSGTDKDGTIASYNWTFISGPKTPTLSNANSAKVTVSSLTTAGKYTLQLEVKDNLGASGKDQVTITVDNANANIAPVANAGNDLSITLPTSSVNISGSGSDADGTIASYRWTFVSGPITPALSNASSARVTVSALTVAGNYTFRLEVKDNAGASAKDDVVVTVKDASLVNNAPVANAGEDKIVTLPSSTVEITGSGTDSDGTIASFKWSFVAGPVTPVLTNTTSARLSVSGMTAIGNYSFRLEVKDNAGATGRDEVIVTVKENVLPKANAGKDLTIFLPTTSVTIMGSGSDEDGMITSYLWTQVSGPAKATLTDASSATMTASSMTAEGSYVFKLVVKDNAGGVSEDKVGVTVRTGSTSTTNFPDASIVSLDEKTPDLAEGDNQYWKDKMVVIYNETGTQLYVGNWFAGSYETIFSKGGLYLYTVMKGAKIIASGKIALTY